METKKSIKQFTSPKDLMESLYCRIGLILKKYGSQIAEPYFQCLKDLLGDQIDAFL